MKKIVLLSLLCTLIFSEVSSQLEVGVKVGLHSTDLAAQGISVFDQQNGSFNLFLQDADYGVHFGLYSRVHLLGIFIEPGLLFNSSGVTYRIDEFDEGGVISIFKNERFNSLDIPLMVGFKFLIFRIYGGPVAHLHINSSSEVFDIGGYEQRFRDASYGWQAGIGLDIMKLRFQLNYEGNFTAFGDHLSFNGNNYSFSDAPARLIATLGIRL